MVLGLCCDSFETLWDVAQRSHGRTQDNAILAVDRQGNDRPSASTLQEQAHESDKVYANLSSIMLLSHSGKPDQESAFTILSQLAESLCVRSPWKER